MIMGDNDLLNLARRVTEIAGRPVVGGLAVFLHGYERTTVDIDLYTDDPQETARLLSEAGLKWNARRREFEIEGVAVHLVTGESFGGAIGRTTRIREVRVVGLADLVRGKMMVGLAKLNRAKDLADVIELIRRVPLSKSFAAKLPPDLRGAFKQMVDAVREDR